MANNMNPRKQRALEAEEQERLANSKHEIDEDLEDVHHHLAELDEKIASVKKHSIQRTGKASPDGGPIDGKVVKELEDRIMTHVQELNTE